MKLSIVTPVYNDVRVAKALASIRAQEDAGEIEIIVIDGGSGPETQAILREDAARVDVLVSEKDRGIYDAMNKGVARATGDVIGILNADDRYADVHVLRDVRRAFTDRAIDVSYGDVVLVDDHDTPVRHWRAGAYHRWKHWLGWMPPHPGFFVRRDVYARWGAFRLDLPIAADYEHQLRVLVKGGARAAYIPRVLVRFSVGGISSGSWRKIVDGNRQVRRAWRVNQLRGGILVPILKPVQKLDQFVRARMRT